MKAVQLHNIFENQVDVSPDATAIEGTLGSYTYRQVDERANRIAHYLRAQGVVTGNLVGIYFARSELPIFAILGILKAGAGYVPIDPIYPEERVRHIVDDAAIKIILSESGVSNRGFPWFSGKILFLDAYDDAIKAHSAARFSAEDLPLDDSNLCYIIYTSGSTGKPKGVMTEHRNIVSFVHSFKKVCALTPEDRVFQGFSLGFDGSVEEIWMAFSNGAVLVTGSEDFAKLPSETAQYMTKMKVTYFSTVPTFLSMIKEDLPTVRLLVLSGEACPQELVDIWAKNGRRMLNVYGPTEATVNTTAALCKAGTSVTIGGNLDGYELFILDEKMRPVPAGELGELYIGGPGLSRGYMNLPEITAKAFVCKPPHIQSSSPRLYKTGDLVSLNQDGELNFFGRIDTQVKIRGYRIELVEIESVLLKHPTVMGAAVSVVERDGLKELAAYVVPKDKTGSGDGADFFGHLQKHLPPYMVPAYLDYIEALPVLTSGKINRSLLPKPKSPLVRLNRTMIAPQTEMEKKVSVVWEKVFKTSPLSIEDDFFLDLGGYSLLAAQMVSLLRNELKTEITIRDIYRFPTIKRFSEHLSLTAAFSRPSALDKPATEKKQSSRAVFESVPKTVRRCCVGLQSLTLYFMYAIATIPLVISMLLYFGYKNGMVSMREIVEIGIVLGIVAYPFMLGLSIISKWIIIGRFKPGHYKVWGMYYFRWWLVTRIERLSGAGFLAGTPLINAYYRLMGARVGKRCLINTAQSSIFDLLSIGDDSSIGSETQLLGYRVEDGLLKIGHQKIGNECFIGIGSTLGLNTTMEDGARLDDLSLLADNDTIKAGESRRGSPCRPGAVRVPEALTKKSKVGRRPILFGFLHVMAIYGIELFMVCASAPTAVLAYCAYKIDNLYLWIGMILCAIPLYEISFCLLLVLVKFLVMTKAKPGIYPVHGMYYVRNWYIDSLLNLSRFIVLPVYTTLYYLPWIRMLGAKVGRRAEFSVISQLQPDLAIVGEESFLADGAIIGGMRLYKGMFELALNKIGKRTFVGNSAVLPVGAVMGDNCLLGVLSSPPENTKGVTQDGTEWLGSPSFPLPFRRKVQGFAESSTFRPTKKLYAQRLCIDALRICIPSLIEIAGLISYLALLYVSYRFLPMPLFLGSAPFITFIIFLASALAVVGVKSLLIGAFTPIIKPLWSPFVWLNEVVNGAYEAISAPIMSLFFGTPFIAWYLRLLGCKIGKHTFIETALFGEFDLVEIGDYAALNNNTIVQNHLFEDRIFKASTLKIGDECSIGNMSVVLYDSEMKQGSSIGPLSLLMKSEILPPFTRWTGIPVEAEGSNANDR
jgi:non-ribosomal peptide synthetase-like protein